MAPAAAKRTAAEVAVAVVMPFVSSTRWVSEWVSEWASSSYPPTITRPNRIASRRTAADRSAALFNSSWVAMEAAATAAAGTESPPRLFLFRSSSQQPRRRLLQAEQSLAVSRTRIATDSTDASDRRPLSQLAHVQQQSPSFEETDPIGGNGCGGGRPSEWQTFAYRSCCSGRSIRLMIVTNCIRLLWVRTAIGVD